MNIQEAIKVLKDHSEWLKMYAKGHEFKLKEAIDTVVAKLEQSLPEDYECPCCGSDKVYLTVAAHCDTCAVTTEI